jgi:hypothetical protein
VASPLQAHASLRITVLCKQVIDGLLHVTADSIPCVWDTKREGKASSRGYHKSRDVQWVTTAQGVMA